MELYILTFEDALAVYRHTTGHNDLPVRPDGLASAVALPMQTMRGQDLYPTIFDKAAALLRSIAENRPFLDGNTRTAWTAAMVFLDLTGIEIIASVDEASNLMLDIAAKRAHIEDIAEFLAQHARFPFSAMIHRSPDNAAQSTRTQRKHLRDRHPRAFSCMKLPTGVILEYYRANGQIGHTDEGEHVDCAGCGRRKTALGSASHLWLRMGTYPVGTNARLPAVIELCDDCHGEISPVAA